MYIYVYATSFYYLIWEKNIYTVCGPPYPELHAYYNAQCNASI